MSIRHNPYTPIENIDDQKVHVSSKVVTRQSNQWAVYAGVSNDTLICCGVVQVPDEQHTQQARRNIIQEGVKRTLSIVYPEKLSVYTHGMRDITTVLNSINLPGDNPVNNEIEVCLTDQTGPVQDMISEFGDSYDSQWHYPFNLSGSAEEATSLSYLYTDGSYIRQKESSATGFAIHNDQQKVISLGADGCTSVYDSTKAEFVAAARGVEAAAEFDKINELTMFTDNRRLARTFSTESNKLRPLENTKGEVSRIKEAAKSFDTFTVALTNRENNRLADALATYGHNGRIRLIPPIL